MVDIVQNNVFNMEMLTINIGILFYIKSKIPILNRPAGGVRAVHVSNSEVRPESRQHTSPRLVPIVVLLSL